MTLFILGLVESTLPFYSQADIIKSVPALVKHVVSDHNRLFSVLL